MSTGYPVSFSIDDMNYLPAPLLQFTRDESPMAAPGEFLCTKNNGSSFLSYSLQLLETGMKVGGGGKILKASLSVATQLFPEIDIVNACFI